jgi:gluconolactonase
MLDRFRVLAGGLDHPEGVAWGRDGRVYAGGEAGQVYAISLDGELSRVADTGGFILGLALDAAGRIYVCDVARGAVLRVDPASGNVSHFTSGTSERPMRAPNWLAFGPDGALYVTDSGDWGKRDGLVWRVRPGGEAEPWTSETDRLPNGCCLAPDGSALFVVETNGPCVTRVRIAADGSSGRAERFADLAGTVPDGIAATADGRFVVTCYRPDRLLLLDADGRVEVLADDPDGQLFGGPSNVAFVGDALDQVAVANLGRWHVAIGDVGIVGEPLAYPELP